VAMREGTQAARHASPAGRRVARSLRADRAMTTRIASGTTTRSSSSSSVSLLARLIRTGIPDGVAAARALRAVLTVLGQRLMDDEASALAAELPPSLARIVEQSEYDGDFDAGEFYARVQRLETTSRGLGREHTNAVLQVLGAVLRGEARGRLLRALPVELGQQLAPVALGDPPVHPRPARSARLSTLASGKPGSRHPLSESAPPGAHAHSVAANDEPHRETKLSSSGGMTQERLGESLATGTPPVAARTLADASDD
jgi:uncharacterized protein (DUF2267 family)